MKFICIRTFVPNLGGWFRQILQSVLRSGCSRRARLLTAVFASLLMLLLTRVGDCCVYSFGDDDLMIKSLGLVSRIVGATESGLPEDILAVNIAYDRQLIPISDEYGIPCGNIDVTDRRSLMRFLEILSNADYKAIAIDVFFDESYSAEEDSALFSLINRMERVFVPTHADAVLNPAIADCRIANGDYTVNFVESSFSKYIYSGCEGRPSMASALFYATEHKSKTGQHSTAMLLPLHYSPKSAYTPDGRKIWYNLGGDLLDMATKDEIQIMAKDKVVVIGDFCMNDMHDTYLGQIAGPVIVINALNALRQGRDHVNIFSAMLLGIVYFLIACFLISGRNFWTILPWRPWPFVRFILSLTGCGAALFILQIAEYFLFDEFHDMQLVVAFLSVYIIYCSKLNRYYPLC